MSVESVTDSLQTSVLDPAAALFVVTVTSLPLLAASFLLSALSKSHLDVSITVVPQGKVNSGFNQQQDERKRRPARNKGR